MFKRLFFLSGIIAFLLAGIMMWFWYLPKMEQENNHAPSPQNSVKQDATEVVTPDSIPE